MPGSLQKPDLHPTTCPSRSDGDRDARSINDAGLQFKFLVPASVVGAVLGRGGSTVAAIKRETGAYVQFTRPGTATNSPKERMMIVAVERVQQLADAVAMVLDAVAAEGAMDKLRTKQFAADKIFFQQVRQAAKRLRKWQAAGEALSGGAPALLKHGVVSNFLIWRGRLGVDGCTMHAVMQGGRWQAGLPPHRNKRLSCRRSSPPCARAR